MVQEHRSVYLWLKGQSFSVSYGRCVAGMIPGMFQQKPDKAVALKQLWTHVALFGSWVVVVRAIPYVLSYFSDSKDELKIEF